MARNFPDIWLGRVEKKLKSSDKAAWLDGIAEIASNVVIVGEGTDAEKCIIHIPVSDFEPGVLINNTAYPIALVQYTDDEVIIALDKYQTEQTSISDDQAIGATYNIIDIATKSHQSAILTNKFKRAAHAIAPVSNSDSTPVIKTTGSNDGTGRKRLKKDDIIALKKAFDDMEVPSEARRLVLCSDHVADLLLQDQSFANQYYNYKSGKIADLYSFQVYEYVGSPYFTASTGTKKSFGAIPVDGDYKASFAFYEEIIGKKTGVTKQYYADAKTDPANQANRLNYRHYFIATPKRKMYIGAIISDVIQ